MSKSLRSYPESERAKVAFHRVEEEKGGLGTLAAMDYIKILKERAIAKIRKEEKEKLEREAQMK
jgi:hypothetical protein